MRKSMLMLAGAGLLAGCNSGNDVPNEAATKSAAPTKPRPAYCFFKDSETKSWAAKRGKDGNILVSGKVYRDDSRYQAILNPATVSGTTAEITPTIVPNAGYAAPDNWWDVKATIPNSAAVTTVNVDCGAKTIASFTLPAKP
jgi:hypothetical protein